MNKEEDINILKQLIREYKRKPETQNEFFIGLIEERALENLLRAYENSQLELEELKNGQIDFWISDKEIEERIRNKFVSKDKIKAKIEEVKDGTYDGKIVLQSLLEKG